MLFRIKNSILIQYVEKTHLTTSVAVNGTTLTVKAVDSNSMADNDYLIVGEIGTENAELLQINGAVSDGTSITVDRSGSDGTRYAHSIDEPVYRIAYDQIQIYRAITETGAKSTLVTIEIQPDDEYTRYEDTSNTTGFGFVRFYNSTNVTYSSYSDAIPYAGQSAKSLQKLRSKVRTLLNEPDEEFLKDEEIDEALNDKQRDIYHERLWAFNETEYSLSSVEDQFAYDIPTNIKEVHTCRFDTQPLAVISQAEWELLHWDTDTSTTDPTHAAIWNDQLKIYPRPSASANTTTLDGNITATDTTITVAATASFKRGDYFRFIIDSEVIYAIASTATTFTGCLRGREGTTAATHTDTTTVTERNIVITGQKKPTDFEDLNDETAIPEPLILAYGVAADFALGKLDKPTLGDRYQVKYDTSIKNLRKRHTLKFTSQFGRVKDPSEVVSKYRISKDSNAHPTNVQES